MSRIENRPRTQEAQRKPGVEDAQARPIAKADVQDLSEVEAKGPDEGPAASFESAGVRPKAAADRPTAQDAPISGAATADAPADLDDPRPRPARRAPMRSPMAPPISSSRPHTSTR